MAEGHIRQPVDADVDVGGGFPPARDIEIAAARGAGPHEDGVVVLFKQRLEAVDPLAQAHDRSKSGDVAHLFVDHRFGQTEPRNLAADHAARFRIAVVNHQLVAERGQIPCNRKRGRAGSDQSDALAIRRRRPRRQAISNGVLVVGRDSLEATDRHRGVLDSHAAARGLAGSVTGAPEYAGKDV